MFQWKRTDTVECGEYACGTLGDANGTAAVLAAGVDFYAGEVDFNRLTWEGVEYERVDQSEWVCGL